jgi:hypothetical protein
MRDMKMYIVKIRSCSTGKKYQLRVQAYDLEKAAEMVKQLGCELYAVVEARERRATI